MLFDIINWNNMIKIDKKKDNIYIYTEKDVIS